MKQVEGGGEKQMDFHAFMISNGKQQDSAVVFNHFQKLLKFLKDECVNKKDPLFYAMEMDVHNNADMAVLFVSPQLLYVIQIKSPFHGLLVHPVRGKSNECFYLFSN